MIYPPLLTLKDEQAYRNHWNENYCQSPIHTYDNILVRFRKNDFDHAFFESVHSKDDCFSHRRAERIDWIKIALTDTQSDRFVGWNKKIKRYDKNRRVVVVMTNYVVVVAVTDSHKASFITAYLADSTDCNGTLSTIEKIRKSPPWG